MTTFPKAGWTAAAAALKPIEEGTWDNIWGLMENVVCSRVEEGGGSNSQH